MSLTQPGHGEVQDPFARMVDLLQAPLLTQAIVVAAELGLADHLADGPRTVDDLAASTGSDAGALHRMLRALAGAGVFRTVDPGRFAQTALSETLCSAERRRPGAAPSLRRWAALWAMPERHAAIGRLGDSVRTGRPAFEQVTGTSWWDHLESRPAVASAFGAAMGDLARGIHSAAADEFDLAGARHVVDIGGGTGALVEQLLVRHPGLRATVLDRPQVTPAAGARLADAGLGDRVTVVAGDFFDADALAATLPSDADVAVLSMILHDWDDERCVTLLRGVRAALPDLTTLLVIDAVVPADDTPHHGKARDLLMLALHPGRERTEAEFVTLLDAAGFRHVDSRAVTASTGLLVAVPDRADTRSVPAHPAAAAARDRAAGLWDDATIPASLTASVRLHADYPAVITADERWSYRTLGERTDAVAAGLLAAGLEPGDRVVLQLGNTIHAVAAWYGLLKAGAVPVCALTAHRRHEIVQTATAAGARWHLVQADDPSFDHVAFAAEIRELVPGMHGLLTVGAGPDMPGVRIEDLELREPSLAERAALATIDAATHPESVAVYQLSGGTTGTSKIIPRLHTEYWYNAVATARWWKLTPGDRLAYGLPLVHNAGITNALHAAHAVGAALVLSTAAPDRLLPLMAEAGATWTMTTPGLAAGYLTDPGFDAAFLAVRSCVLTVAQVPRPVFDGLSERGVHVVQAFGMTEGLLMFTPLDASPELRATTVGLPISPLDEVRVLVPGTLRAAEPGSVGELCARGPYTIRGYLGDDPAPTTGAFTPDGFYRSGDLVSLRTVEGRPSYAIEGRVKDLVDRGGEKINPSEVEVLLRRHPAIADVAVVGVPDPRLGERACAVLVLVAGAERPGVADLGAFLEAAGLARFKWPERVEVRPALPRTAVGKLAKAEIRAQLRTADRS